jgi:hypothetical protein
MQPINITIPQHQRSPQAPRSLLTQQPGPFDWLVPRSIAQAAARLLVSVGGGIVTGAIGRVIPWEPQAIALALTLALAAVVGLGFLWRVDRRGAWVLLAYALFGAIGASMAIGFGGGDGQ